MATTSTTAPRISAPTAAALGITIRVRVARDDPEREAAYALRREVFCREQGLFDRDDRDDIDRVAVLVIAEAVGEVIGTVRLYQDRDGDWWGGRLAVRRDWRRTGHVGTTLIRFAVGYAKGQGGRTFLAHVQEAHVAMFMRLGWMPLAAETFAGAAHRRMQADLSGYGRVSPDGEIVVPPDARERRP